LRPSRCEFAAPAIDPAGPIQQDASANQFAEPERAMIRATTIALLLLVPVAAEAGKAEADSCAKALPQEARLIYDTVAPKITAASNVKDVVTENTRQLALSGKVSRGTARDSATSAGQCLLKLT